VTRRERVSKLIQCRPKIEDAVSDQDAQFWRWLLGVMKPGDEPPFRVHFTNRLVEIGLGKFLHRAHDRVEVFLGPVELQDDPK
jgi:hypothetical protein